jgi:two-component system, LytTR family, response regulator
MRALIVDDEVLARQQLRRFLRDVPGVTVAGECDSGATAIEAILSSPPDVVFLDVQMPQIDGFGVVEAIGTDAMPATVFVTAHAEHALRAFRAHAVDYLLKPVDPGHVAEAIARIRKRPATTGALEAMMTERPGAEPYMRRFIVRRDGRIHVVPADRVDWIEAADNDVVIHAGRESLRTRGTLTALMERLDPARFARLHRSAVVNLERVREVQPWFKGDSIVMLHDGTQLTIGRVYREAFMKALGG